MLQDSHPKERPYQFSESPKRWKGIQRQRCWLCRPERSPCCRSVICKAARTDTRSTLSASIPLPTEAAPQICQNSPRSLLFLPFISHEPSLHLYSPVMQSIQCVFTFSALHLEMVEFQIRTISSMLHPLSAGAYKKRPNLPDTQFRKAYERGDLPIAVEHHGFKNVIKWKVRLWNTCVRVLKFFQPGKTHFQISIVSRPPQQSYVIYTAKR